MVEPSTAQISLTQFHFSSDSSGTIDHYDYDLAEQVKLGVDDDYITTFTLISIANDSASVVIDPGHLLKPYRATLVVSENVLTINGEYGRDVFHRRR